MDCLGSNRWDDVSAKIKSLNFGRDLKCEGYEAGIYKDWQLPDIKQLVGVINAKGMEPISDDPESIEIEFIGSGDEFLSAFTTGQQPDSYWSATKEYGYDGYEPHEGSWAVSMYDGYVTNMDRAGSISLWAVRGSR